MRASNVRLRIEALSATNVFLDLLGVVPFLNAEHMIFSGAP